ncbi:acyl carrier protein phosphodiesterase [Sunxiuqinia elliptica]|uniref:Acyl carrier protein phosphodiesterase n=1 Tax=Sunxiuqinia elliptica TaxID=655355 RepID=A0A1I2EDJ6_9BACT|nr:ACP phosphodiesterase [Sunxiuqinia elliptica]SFE90737.1 Acyl carrier protein phosphodiesterase [Sunxiuqinia elliptica]
MQKVDVEQALLKKEYLRKMNYLAHLYLSGEDEHVLVGNFIGDYVKGKQFQRYPLQVQSGILLHRQIDWFTDRHALVKDCGNRFRENYGRYAGIVTDVIFDHFLAARWTDYSASPLRPFAKKVHAVLLTNFALLPKRVKLFLPFIIQHKRLESYASLEGIHESLAIMGTRTSLPEEADFALEVLQRDYESIRQEFEAFFAELVDFVEANFEVYIQKPALK